MGSTTWRQVANVCRAEMGQHGDCGQRCAKRLASEQYKYGDDGRASKRWVEGTRRFQDRGLQVGRWRNEAGGYGGA